MGQHRPLQLTIEGLPHEAKVDQLLRVFDKHGPIAAISVKSNPIFGATGFVEYENVDSLRSALAMCRREGGVLKTTMYGKLVEVRPHPACLVLVGDIVEGRAPPFRGGDARGQARGNNHHHDGPHHDGPRHGHPHSFPPSHHHQHGGGPHGDGGGGTHPAGRGGGIGGMGMGGGGVGGGGGEGFHFWGNRGPGPHHEGGPGDMGWGGGGGGRGGGGAMMGGRDGGDDGTADAGIVDKSRSGEESANR